MKHQHKPSLGSLYQVDSIPVEIAVIGDSRKPIRKPTLYLLIDSASKEVVGCEVSLGKPNMLQILSKLAQKV